MGLAVAMAFGADAQRILFDNTKAESSGNGDWVIDADVLDLYFSRNGTVSTTGNQSDAQRYPTPAQSTVTASTPENYWQGGISAWGIECVKTGYTVESLPWNVPITYGDASNVQDLSNYDVYIVDEPNIVFTATEKAAILNFVYNGGGIYMVSDHNGSDRNNDGWDSPHIWNDLMSNNTVQNNPFGLSVNLLDFSGGFGITNVASDSVINGPYGTADQVDWSDGTSFTIDTTVNPTVKGDVFKTGTSASDVLVAHGYYGKGRFAIMGDSSPTDDGSGDPGDQLYNGWTADASGNHRILIMDATIWLAGGRVATAIVEPSAEARISLYPNPLGNILNVKAPELCTLQLFDMSGQKVLENTVEPGYLKSLNTSDLCAGVYTYTMVGTNTFAEGKIIKK